MLPRISVIGLPVKLGHRQEVISLPTLVVIGAKVGAEAEAEAEERAIEGLLTLPLVVEMKKRRLSLVDCDSQHTVYVYTYTHQT